MKTICKFSKNMSVKSQKSKQRNSEGYKIAVFNAYLLRRKIFSENLALFSLFRCLPLRGIFFKSAKKSTSRWLPIRESFLQTLYNSQIFVLINEIIKIFSISWRVFVVLAGYYLRGYFIAGQIWRFRCGI